MKTFTKEAFDALKKRDLIGGTYDSYLESLNEKWVYRTELIWEFVWIERRDDEIREELNGKPIFK